MAGFDLTALGTGLFLAWLPARCCARPGHAKRAPKAAKAVEVS
jgi:hypothetical protein